MLYLDVACLSLQIRGGQTNNLSHPKLMFTKVRKLMVASAGTKGLFFFISAYSTTIVL